MQSSLSWCGGGGGEEISQAWASIWSCFQPSVYGWVHLPWDRTSKCSGCRVSGWKLWWCFLCASPYISSCNKGGPCLKERWKNRKSLKMLLTRDVQFHPTVCKDHRWIVGRERRGDRTRCQAWRRSRCLGSDLCQKHLLSSWRAQQRCLCSPTTSCWLESLEEKRHNTSRKSW